MIYLTAGGEAGHHIDSLVAPLLVHDLPVTLWSPGRTAVRDSAGRGRSRDMADRLVVDGSGWSRQWPRHASPSWPTLAGSRLAIFDFALVRQSRWREAIAATFDLPEFTPFLRSIRRIAVTYGDARRDRRARRARTS